MVKSSEYKSGSKRHADTEHELVEQWRREDVKISMHFQALSHANQLPNLFNLHDSYILKRSTVRVPPPFTFLCYKDP